MVPCREIETQQAVQVPPEGPSHQVENDRVENVLRGLQDGPVAGLVVLAGDLRRFPIRRRGNM